MHNQLHQHFKTLFHTHQYRFRAGHSTEHAILENIDSITTKMENGNTALHILLDLAKAFDTIDHSL